MQVHGSASGVQNVKGITHVSASRPTGVRDSS
jgi:hypothetical protein